MKKPKSTKKPLAFLHLVLFLAVAAFLCFVMFDFLATPHSDISFKDFLNKEIPPTSPEPEQTQVLPPPPLIIQKVQKKNEPVRKRSLTLAKTKGEKTPFVPYETCKKKKNVRYETLCKLGDMRFCSNVQPAEVMQDFWIVAPIYSYNQKKTQMLYELHENFRDYISTIGMSFCTIEGIRDELNQTYKVTSAGNEPYEIQIKLYDEDYIRENLLNVAIRKLPRSWEYVAWIDAHQMFINSYWWEESIVKMEKNASVQLFQKSVRLNARNQSMAVKNAVIWVSLLMEDLDNVGWIEYGNAYGIRRELYDKIGTIMDTCIATGCDLSYVKASIPSSTKFSLLYYQHPYASQFESWINSTRMVFNASRAVVRGEIEHFEHEHYIDYDLVPQAFSQAGFNISRDIARDENFTIYITNPRIKEVMPSLRLKFSISP